MTRMTSCIKSLKSELDDGKNRVCRFQRHVHLDSRMYFQGLSGVFEPLLDHCEMKVSSAYDGNAYV